MKKKQKKSRERKKKRVSSVEKLRHIVCGLGNPGEDYRWTRHNVGYMVIDRMMVDVHSNVKPGQGNYLFGEIEYEDDKLITLKPLSFMNLSGLPVKEAVEFFNAEPETCLVVVDDVNLPFGRLRLRRSGSDGGHNGLASIIYHLATENFPRLRIGIGRPEGDKPLSEFVLLRFSEEEEGELSHVIERAADCVRTWFKEGIEKAMNVSNREVN